LTALSSDEPDRADLARVDARERPAAFACYLRAVTWFADSSAFPHFRLPRPLL